MKILFIILSTLLCSLAYGSLHLDAAGGTHLSSFQTKGRGIVVSPGLNFKTDLGHNFSREWALEWSTQVKFTEIAEFMVWDTLMTFGVRHHFKGTPWFARGFWGRTPTVFFLDDAPHVTHEMNASRIQFQGRVVGASVGKFYRSEEGRDWFLEYSASYQSLKDQTGIRNDGDVPKITFNNRAENEIHIFSICAMIGVRVF